jgi:Rps23 Pro-64 3,4-dihydroxylase Tpa1-like proline 4-hydroxylase
VLHATHCTTAAALDADGSPFRLNPDLDVEALRHAFVRDRRVRIYSLLSEGAVELYRHLDQRAEWIHLISTESGVLKLDPTARAALSAEQWAEIEAGAHERCRTGFQYRYEALRVPDEAERGGPDDLLSVFSEFLLSPPMLSLLAAVTGHEDVVFSDGQATAYGVGDFLTGHDDDVAGKNRLAAYVFGLTPGWRLEWGGLLLFHGHRDRTAEALAPRFNTLDLFQVPQQHSVSMVTPAAPHRRFAVTGWLRPSGTSDQSESAS